MKLRNQNSQCQKNRKFGKVINVKYSLFKVESSPSHSGGPPGNIITVARLLLQSVAGILPLVKQLKRTEVVLASG